MKTRPLSLFFQPLTGLSGGISAASRVGRTLWPPAVAAKAHARNGVTGAMAPVVAYHAACSLQHGQQIREEPKTLLRRMGFA